MNKLQIVVSFLHNFKSLLNPVIDDNFNMFHPPKTYEKIVRENRSEKTTFIKLLCRLYESDKGKIFLNGVNIQKYDYGSYIACYNFCYISGF